MENPMSITSTIWEPHTFTPPYDKPVTIPSKTIHLPHPEFHPEHIMHSIQSHLPWHHAHRAHQPFPETDISETASAYRVEMALAGISDRESVEIKWPGPRTLVVQGVWKGAEVVGRLSKGVDIGDMKVDGEMWKKGSVGGEMNGVNGVEEELKKGGGDAQVNGIECGEQPVYILRERGVGVFQRTFELPVDVDVAGCTARLEHGLLRIDVPKKVLEKPGERRHMFDDTCSPQVTGESA
jgi:HSP20 family molecular chaperone IbpA